MKTKTIGFILALTTMLTTFNMEAQDTSKVKEFGIGLASLNGFSLQYRWGNEHRLYRLSGNISGSGSVKNSSNSSSTDSSVKTIKTITPINLNFGLSFSILKIKSVSEKFGFLYGTVYTLSYSINQSTTKTDNSNQSSSNTTTNTTKQNSQTYNPSVGIALGAVYKINSSFLLYGEIDPYIYYSYNKTTMNTTTSTSNSNIQTINNNPSSTNSFGLSNLSNSFATLTIVYRITK